MKVEWDRLLLAWMHDPVDKALDIRGHESRAARYASRALDREVTRSEIKFEASTADSLAAIAERIAMPTAGQNGERAVGIEAGRLEVRHPVSAAPDVLQGLELDETGVLQAVDDIVGGLPTPRSRFLALWRLLPERLAESLGPNFVRLPADTRVPDHTLIQHADITSGIWASLQGTEGGALLALSLGPVQKFIEAARSVRDLWSGSAMLSWLTFQGLRPVLETLGPTALVYPALRGNPLMDLWLREQEGLKQRVPLPSKTSRRSPSIPNRFVALAPWGADGVHARTLENDCAEAVRSAWRSMADDVRTCLDPRLRTIDPNWARLWHDQVESFFEVTTAVTPVRVLDDATLARLIGVSSPSAEYGRPHGDALGPPHPPHRPRPADSFEQVWPESGKVRGLAEVIPAADRPSYDQRSAGRWQAQMETSARLMEAQRSVRHVPASTGPDRGEASPPKCSLLGSYEQMGPSRLEHSRKFWEQAPESVGGIQGVRLRNAERFSAVALCKRFAAPARLADELQIESSALRFPDTATVAAAEWLAEAEINPDEVRQQHGQWSGRWLHLKGLKDTDTGEDPPPDAVWERIRAARKDNRPPAYYAILAMDADRMGQWLKGEHGPRVSEVLHPRMRHYYERLGDEAVYGLDARRPVGPALHAAISEALNGFASHVAPQIVKEHRGTMIYSGGDDVLALLPARKAVACADELYRAFRGNDEDAPGWTRQAERRLPAMGDKATLSAGIAFVHHMHDLRLALEAARAAEKAAKDGGRNLLTLYFMRRSGEHAQANLPWNCTQWFQERVQRFAEGDTDRWAYRLRAELPTLEANALPDAAVSAEIRRLVSRTQQDAVPGAAASAGGEAEGWWRKYSDSVKRHVQDSGSSSPSPGESLKAFVLLCQGASFLARGYDD